MSNLLPVGTRVKIVGPDCNGDNWAFGRIGVIARVHSFDKDNPYYVQDLAWRSASSIQEINEQAMKIENETQAKAARDYIAAKEQWHKLMEQDKPELSQLRTALAAYESRDKVKEIAEGLSEEELACLKWRGISYLKRGEVTRTLIEKEILTSDALCPTPAGRACLDLRSQKRELKWEVRFAECNTFVCAVDHREKAENIAKAMNKSFCSRYEVREVK